MCRMAFLACCLAAAGSVFVMDARAAQFFWLTDRFSRAEDVAPNGRYVTGFWDVAEPPGPGEGDCCAIEEVPFLWTREDGIISLPLISDDSIDGIGRAVSNTGAVVGWSGEENGLQAFLWTESTGTIGLGDLPGGRFSSVARGVSADGSVVVGFGVSESGNEAFRWTEETGMVGLGDLPGGEFLSEASDVSADGTIVVGWSKSRDPAIEGNEAFRWTQETGMVGLGRLPGATSSTASAISSDGSVIVGNSGTGFRWSQEIGMVSIEERFNAVDLTADGSVIVGGFVFPAVWDEKHGIRSLQELLVQQYGLGASLQGTTLRSVRGISDDGLTIVGYGIRSNGREQAWVAIIPEPSTVTLAFLAVMVLALSRCRARRPSSCGSSGPEERAASRCTRRSGMPLTGRRMRGRMGGRKGGLP